MDGSRHIQGIVLGQTLENSHDHPLQGARRSVQVLARFLFIKERVNMLLTPPSIREPINYVTGS